MTATAGSDVVQSGRKMFDDFFQHLWPYIDNNTANVCEGPLGTHFENENNFESKKNQSTQKVSDKVPYRFVTCCLPNGQAFVAYPHRPMTLHSPTEKSIAVLNHKILEANSQVQNVKLGGHQTCHSINQLWHELCDMLHRLVGTTAPEHHDSTIQE
ncbi:uncharacterized protein TNCV_415041 [Trichonephila clavipes]|nr:uncharacterized protein TNCV_415041 [Trichonephila clavipes]